MSAAWLLDLGHDRLAAVGAGEQLHLAYDAQPFEVVHTPAHCRRALLWGGGVVPVIDLGVWIDGKASRSASGYIGIYGYFDHGRNQVRFGALWLNAPPRCIIVTVPACEPAPRAQGLAPLALSFFEHAGACVGIIDLSAVFGGLPEAGEACNQEGQKRQS